jgi:hypothetical protein
MYPGPQHPILREMEVLARQEQLRHEAARDRLLRQARQARAGRAPRLRRLSPATYPWPGTLTGVRRVGALLRRAVDPLLRGISPRPPVSNPKYQTG